MIKSLMKMFGSSSEEKSSEKVAVSDAPVKLEGLGDLENFVDYIVRALVDNPQDVKISVEKKEDLNIIKIDCKKEDVGKVVGKKGRTIMSIRELVSGAGSRLKHKVTVEVID